MIFIYIWFSRALAKDEQRREKLEEERRREIIQARNRISLRAIEIRFPYISLIEFYCLKKHLYPYFAKDELTRDDAWQLRKELYREITKRY